MLCAKRLRQRGNNIQHASIYIHYKWRPTPKGKHSPLSFLMIMGLLSHIYAIFYSTPHEETGLLKSREPSRGPRVGERRSADVGERHWERDANPSRRAPRY